MHSAILLVLGPSFHLHPLQGCQGGAVVAQVVLLPQAQPPNVVLYVYQLKEEQVKREGGVRWDYRKACLYMCVCLCAHVVAVMYTRTYTHTHTGTSTHTYTHNNNNKNNNNNNNNNLTAEYKHSGQHAGEYRNVYIQYTLAPTSTIASLQSIQPWHTYHMIS